MEEGSAAASSRRSDSMKPKVCRTWRSRGTRPLTTLTKLLDGLCGGQRNLLMFALELRYAKGSFELLDGRTDRRLLNTEFLSRSRKGAMPRCRLEDNDMPG